MSVMPYILSFLEGIIAFISPCLLPMLPVYISFFAAAKQEGSAARNALGFVLGFTVLFMLLGAFSGALGGFLRQYHVIVNAVCGTIMVLFGLNFTGIVKIPLLNRYTRAGEVKVGGFFGYVLFGMIFSISWTPCVGVFLGSAIMLAATSGGALEGTLMLLCFSLGLGLPFIICAVLTNKMTAVFDFLKRNQGKIKIISGALLIVLGILIATGIFERIYSLI